MQDYMEIDLKVVKGINLPGIKGKFYVGFIERMPGYVKEGFRLWGEEVLKEGV